MAVYFKQSRTNTSFEVQIFSVLCGFHVCGFYNSFYLFSLIKRNQLCVLLCSPWDVLVGLGSAIILLVFQVRLQLPRAGGYMLILQPVVKWRIMLAVITYRITSYRCFLTGITYCIQFGIMCCVIIFFCRHVEIFLSLVLNQLQFCTWKDASQ